LTRISTPGIQINAGRLRLNNGGLITTRKIDDGNVRDIDITVDEDIIIRGTVKYNLPNNGKQIFVSSAISSNKLNGIGDGGNITLQTFRSKMVLKSPLT
jgi:hypothetical protein